MSRPTGLGEYTTEELLIELHHRGAKDITFRSGTFDVVNLTDQYQCPSYSDNEGVLRDCECGRCGKTPRSQDEVIDFMSDPETIARAAEGSMEKRQALLDRVDGAQELDEILDYIEDYAESGTDGTYNPSVFKGNRVIARQKILDWHSKQAKAVLDRLDAANVVKSCKEDCSELEHQYHRGSYDQCGLVDDAIEAERAKLKI